MENYIVSARKYRPSTFQSVVGQKALTQTLKNAINSNKLAHAYLFCGPRGVGKTSCARIFAKTINCLTPTASGEACNECESCKAFNEQRSYNIHELDAASNNSVDDIRDLIAQVQIPPQIGKYKVFIIDEVHMLSAAAFNAFLKTLEEPPHHAIFILATTEKHKLLPTILSRCQIYDFNRISPRDTVEHLMYVASQEGITVDPQALGIIAQKADGGMRDALSIFDQVVSFTGGNLTYQAVIDNLNVLDYEYYFRVVDAFLENSVSKALLILNDIISKGFDPQHFITGLSSHLREVMVSKDPVTLPLVEAGQEVALRYHEQGKKCSNPFLYKAIEISNECDLNYRASRNKRLLVEIALIRISQLTAPQTVQGMPEGAAPLQRMTPQQPQPQQQPQQANQQHVQQTQQPAAAYTAPGQQPQPAQQPQQFAQQQPQQFAQQPAAQSQNGIPQTPVSVPPSPARGAVKTGLPGIKNISIKKGISKSNGDAPREHQELQEMNQPVDDEKLRQAWVSFTKTIPTEAILVNTMLACRPVLTSTTDFEIVVENPEQVDRIRNKGVDLLHYLRVTLQNSRLMMTVRESEKNEKQKAFSQRDKYNAMLEVNPDLTLLRDTFNLEFA
ncbi:MAG: DNA polymerase III subunit gamma/tau [Bacteroidales bacterium]